MPDNPLQAARLEGYQEQERRVKITLHNQKAGAAPDVTALRIAQQALDEGWTGRVGVLHDGRAYSVQIGTAGVNVWVNTEEHP